MARRKSVRTPILHPALPKFPSLNVIDVYRRPTFAKGEQIVAAPTLIKKRPLPMRKRIGDMSDRKKVLIGLDIRKKDGA